MFKSSLVLIYLLSSSSAFASWTGFYKAQLQDRSIDGRDNYSTSLNNLLSIKHKQEYSYGIASELSYDLAVLGSKNSGAFNVDSSSTSKGYRLIDLDTKPVHGKNNAGERVSLTQNLNRLSANYSSQNYEVTVGRQPFGVGSARVVNPLDVWVPFNVMAIDTEELYGIDGIRYKYYFGAMGELEAALFFQDYNDLGDLSIVVDSKFSSYDFDFTILAAKFYDNGLLGIDFQGDVYGVGIWGEAAYNDIDLGRNYFRVSLGSEYRFTSDMTSFVEYHFNGAGENLESKYLLASLSKAYSEGAVYLLGRHYVTLGGSLQAHALLALSSSYMHSFTDKSGYISLKAEYNFKENFYVDLGGFAGLSSGQGSEFSRYPDSIFSSLRYYY